MKKIGITIFLLFLLVIFCIANMALEAKILRQENIILEQQKEIEWQANRIKFYEK